MMVPSGWRHIRLNDICIALTSGSRDWAKYYSEQGSKFIRMTNLQRESIFLNLTNLKYVDVTSNSSDGQRTSLKAGDILMSITAELGKVGWVHEQLGESYINQHTALIRLDNLKAHSKYIAYLLSSTAMNYRINKLNDAGAKAGLNLSTIRSIALEVPPLPEQQKIAKILSTWDKAISTTEQLITQSQQQKKALMQQLLTGKKRLLDNNGQPFKGNWTSVHFKDILKVVGGNAFKSEEFKLSGLPIVRISNIKSNNSICLKSGVYVTEQKKFNKFLITKGDVLIAMSGATTGKVGQYKLSASAYLNQRVGKFEIKDNKASKNYIFQLLRVSKIQHSILIDAIGGAQPNISNKDIERIKIDLPPLPEQQKIAAVLTAADKEIELLNQKLNHLKQEKKALMQQLLTGKRRVQVDHKECA